MKTSKRVLSLVLMLLLVMSIAVPAFAADYVNPNKGTRTIYLTQKTIEDWTTVRVPLANGNGNETMYTIKRSSVKVTAGTSGAELYGFYKYNSTNMNQYKQYDDSWGEEYNSYTWNYAAILKIKSTGTAKVSYTLGGVKYTINVRIKAYTNPVSSITLNGVKSGNNFASATKKQYSNYNNPLSLPKTTKSAKLVVKPADGWKITSVELEDTTSGLERTIRNYNSPMRSATISWGTLNAKHNYDIYVDCVNTTTGASMYVYYYIKGAGAVN